jgi:hypothetical protein
VAQLLELLAQSKISDCNFTKIRSNNDSNDHNSMESMKSDIDIKGPQG